MCLEGNLSSLSLSSRSLSLSLFRCSRYFCAREDERGQAIQISTEPLCLSRSWYRSTYCSSVRHSFSPTYSFIQGQRCSPPPGTDPTWYTVEPVSACFGFCRGHLVTCHVFIGRYETRGSTRAYTSCATRHLSPAMDVATLV